MDKEKIQRVVLIGYRAVGKSSVGRLLAGMLGWEYLSTDALIERRQKSSIMEIVDKSGWSHFRNLEQSVVKSITSRMRAVIDCGGGVVETAENMKLLQAGSLVVWIDADISTISRRIRDSDQHRPLLSEANIERDISTNYQRRRPLYQRYAGFTVNSDDNDPEAICKKILAILRQHE
jgi:shikimate kinase